jgi:chromate transport protein ChrA
MSKPELIIRMLQLLKKIEIPVIYFTASAIILSGFLRLADFAYSDYIFSFALLPYVATRGLYYIAVWRKRDKKQNTNEKNRLYVYIAVFITILLSMLNFFSADFFVIFLIMVDFLLLQNREKNSEQQN